MAVCFYFYINSLIFYTIGNLHIKKIQNKRSYCKIIWCGFFTKDVKQKRIKDLTIVLFLIKNKYKNKKKVIFDQMLIS